MDFNELMQAFGKKVNLEGWTADKNEQYQLDIDGMLVTCLETSTGTQMALLAEAGTLPPEGRENFFRMLLEAMYLENDCSGMVFSLKPDSDTVVLHRQLALDGMDLDDFKVALESFVNRLERWRYMINEFRDIVDHNAVKAFRSDDAMMSPLQEQQDGLVRV